MSLRQIVEQRSGAVIVSTIAAIAVGTAIPLYATGVFNSPPPACYLTAPSSGASVVGSQALTAKCGASTANTQFLVDGTVVAGVGAAPFTATWNSASIADGSHTVSVLACDATQSCVTSQSVSFTTANVPHSPVNTVLPVVSGNLSVGSTDSCSSGTWTGDTTGGFTYQWKDGAGNISGATSATYVLASGEIGASIYCHVTASGASGSASADSTAVGPVVAAGSLTANVWISPTGSNIGANCGRTGLASAPSAANACATPQKACNLAQSGDTIGVMAGMYTIGFALDNTCTQNITFQTVAGAFADFESFGSINATNVTLQGDVIGYGVGFSLGIMSLTGTNIVWNDVNLYCKTQAGSAWAQLHQSDSGEDACNSNVSISAAGFTWNGGDQEQWAVCLAHCTHTNTPNGSNPNDDFVQPLASNVLIENVIFRNYWAMDPTGLSPQLHSEEWFLNGGTGITFKNVQAYDCGPPASLGYPVNTSCNSAWMFVGRTGTNNTSNNVSLIQDIIAPTSSVNGAHHVAFQWGHLFPLATEYALTVNYSSLNGGFSLCGVTVNKCDGSTITGTNISLTGSVVQRGAGSCFTNETDAANVYYFTTGSAVNCGTGNPNTVDNSTPDTSLWSSPGPPNYTYVPLAPIQGKGENTVCATLPGGVDLFGTTRPSSPTLCDAGAVQH